MRPYLIPIALVLFLCLPTRPLVFAWTWLRGLAIFRPLLQLEGRIVGIEAAGEKPEPKPPAQL